MKVNTAVFVKELEWTSRFVHPKSTIPILCNVLLEVDKHTLKITGTDLDMAGVTQLDGIETEPCKVKAYVFWRDLIAKLPNWAEVLSDIEVRE